MKTVLYFLIIAFLAIMLMALTGCKSCPPTVVSTNNLTQTNYDYQCLSGDKTFSEIIICQKAQDAAEKKQNNITNEFLKTK